MGPRLAPIDPPMDPRLYDNDRYPDPHRRPPRDFLNASSNRSPPYHRSSTLPPAGRLLGNKPNRPRKSSITQSARKPKHERTKSKDHQRRMSYDRKAMSAEPSSLPAIYGKRWEDLIDAAASATEEDRDLTPVSAFIFHSRQGGKSNLDSFRYLLPQRWVTVRHYRHYYLHHNSKIMPLLALHLHEH
jgi:hypothetical protein